MKTVIIPFFCIFIIGMFDYIKVIIGLDKFKYHNKIDTIMQNKRAEQQKKAITIIIIGIYIFALVVGVFFSGTFLTGCDGCDGCDNCSGCDSCSGCSSCNSSEKSSKSSSSKTAS
jgi:hypothetical protein